MSYRIGVRTAAGYSAAKGRFGEIEKEDLYGDFIVRKEYKVSNPSKREPIYCIIIQYVNKTTTIKDAKGNTYNTTASIKEFTDNPISPVDFSNDSYFELFELMDNGSGESKDSDRFQNGPLTKYDKKGALTYTADDKKYEIYKTEGDIKVIGENCFISRDNPNFESFKRLRWDTRKNTPANGLPYLPYSDELYNTFFSSSDSPILVHEVNVNWSIDNPESIVMSDSYTKPYARKGGRKRKTYRKQKPNKKRKTYRKRKTYLKK